MIRRVLFVCTGNIFRSLTQRRTLTRAIMDESHLVVAMSTDHQATIKERYGREVPLYLEVCGEAAQWLPDIEDVIPNYQTNRVAVEADEEIREALKTLGLALPPARRSMSLGSCPEAQFAVTRRDGQ